MLTPAPLRRSKFSVYGPGWNRVTTEAVVVSLYSNVKIMNPMPPASPASIASVKGARVKGFRVPEAASTRDQSPASQCEYSVCGS